MSPTETPSQMLSRIAKCYASIPFVASSRHCPWPSLTYINSLFASSCRLSFGQYGHLNRDPFANRLNDSSATTCPHGIIIGGLSSVVCSFDTGQTKMEWKW